MPNRHAPHSHVAGLPKQAKPCYHCNKPIQLQPKRVEHSCTELCHPHGAEHDYSHEYTPTLVRYFDDQFNEMCKDCFDKPAHKRRKAVQH